MNIMMLQRWFIKLLTPALISAVITAFVSISIIYEQQQNLKAIQYNNMSVKSRQLAEWLDTNFSIINNVLLEVEPITQGCDNTVLFELRSLMFNVAPVVEIGIVDKNGILTCTSWQKHNYSIQVQVPPDTYGLRFSGPVTVEYMKQPAFVLARTLKDGSEVNALVRMSWLHNQLKNYSSELGFTGLIDSDTGEAIVLNGHYSKPRQKQYLPIDDDKIVQAYFDNHREQIAAYSPLTTLPDLSIVISDEKRLLIDDQPLLSPTWIAIIIILWAALCAAFNSLFSYFTDTGHQLRNALKREEFINYYQPIISNADKKIVGVEVLMRWQHPIEGFKSPITFIPEAEEKGYLNRMTSQQLKKSYRDLQSTIEQDPSFMVTINISASHLLSSYAIDEFIRYKALIPGLTLEVTEDVLIDDANKTIRAAFTALNQAGIKIAIDDFGTGYCGLSYLSQLPVTYLKADKSFIASAGTDAMNAHVLEMIVSLAKNLGLIIIAEGVETIEQSQSLDELKVELHQGWLYSKALPIDDLYSLLDQHDVIIQ